MTNKNDGEGAATNAPNVHNGTYTITSKTDGHFTLKLYTAQSGALAGKRILSLLIGRDNENDFIGVAFWDDQKQTAYAWRKYKGMPGSYPLNGLHWDPRNWSAVEQKLSIWCDLATRGDGSGDPVDDYPIPGQSNPLNGFWGSSGYSLLLEGRCCVCNKKLTNPESILSGIGPTCASRS